MNKIIVCKLMELILETIENQEIETESFIGDILNQYGLTQDEYSEYKTKHLDEEKVKDSFLSNTDILDTVKEVYDKKSRNYFTISSKYDFNELITNKDERNMNKALVYHPLNDHSRNKLSKGDIIFCYRQGQFGSLSRALETRGIYAVGIAATDPLELYPEKERHNKYGIVVYIPLLLNSHLQLRNIQMHPNTIDLTPYNGNRNDALQYIPDEKHYSTLISLISEVNPKLKTDMEYIFGIKVKKQTLPDAHWEVKDTTLVKSDLLGDRTLQEEFNIDAFVRDLNNSGFIFSKQIVTRFVASLCTKPFVILTGLSGSGKTQLALSFAKWICSNKNSYFDLLKRAMETEKLKTKYQIIRFSSDILEIINNDGNKGTIIPLPTKLIYEWYDAIKLGNMSLEDDPKLKREIFDEISIYQKQMHSFYADLHRIAVVMNEIDSEIEPIVPIIQYELVPVGAEWTNREPLIGYPNALQSDKYERPENGVLDLLINAKNNPDNPFFLILDEMNLSHVERYFADFLSVMESGEPISLYNDSEDRSPIPAQIKIPDNLFIIGTVNVDETTYMFSPKVLDRANTIEFKVSYHDMENYFKGSKKINLSKLESKGINMASDFLSIATSVNKNGLTSDNYSITLLSFFEELREIGAEFGFRSASEIYRLIEQLRRIDSTISDDDVIDIALMQKLLPKLHGGRRKICPILHRLAKLCVSDENLNVEKEFLIGNNSDGFDKSVVKYPLSLEKIARMYKNAIDYGYASYAEA